MNLRLRNSLLAGLCASALHWTLMTARDYLGIIPEFQPYQDLQGILAAIPSNGLQGVYLWFVPYVSGALLIGFLFGRVYARLPGKTALRKGVVFGLGAWLLMGLLFFNFLGHGMFALDLGLGFKPAALTLVMLLIYSVTMSLVYDWLNKH